MTPSGPLNYSDVTPGEPEVTLTAFIPGLNFPKEEEPVTTTLTYPQRASLLWTLIVTTSITVRDPENSDALSSQVSENLHRVRHDAPTSRDEMNFTSDSTLSINNALLKNISKTTSDVLDPGYVVNSGGVDKDKDGWPSPDVKQFDNHTTLRPSGSVEHISQRSDLSENGTFLSSSLISLSLGSTTSLDPGDSKRDEGVFPSTPPHTVKSIPTVGFMVRDVDTVADVLERRDVNFTTTTKHEAVSTSSQKSTTDPATTQVASQSFVPSQLTSNNTKLLSTPSAVQISTQGSEHLDKSSKNNQRNTEPPGVGLISFHFDSSLWTRKNSDISEASSTNNLDALPSELENTNVNRLTNTPKPRYSVSQEAAISESVRHKTVITEPLDVGLLEPHDSPSVLPKHGNVRTVFSESQNPHSENLEPEPEGLDAPEPEPEGLDAPEPEPEGLDVPEPEPEGLDAPEPEPEGLDAPEPERLDAPEPEPEGLDAPEPEPEGLDVPEPEPEGLVASEPEPEGLDVPEPEPEGLDAPEPEPEGLDAPEPEPEGLDVPEPEPEGLDAPEPEPEGLDAPEPEPEGLDAPKSNGHQNIAQDCQTKLTFQNGSEHLSGNWSNETANETLNEALKETLNETLNENLNETHLDEETTSIHKGIKWSTSKAILFIVQLVIMLETIFGNLMVILSVKMEKKLQTPFNYYIVNLAFTDMNVGVSVMSLFMIYNLMDRLWSVTWSLHYRNHNSASKSLIIILMTWVLVALIWLPPFIYDRVVNAYPSGDCYWDTVHNKNLLSAWFPTLFPQWYVNFSYWMAYINSALNPILYPISSPEFRAAYKKVFKVLICKN
ncbi:LIAT1-like 4 [Homarus americanus]|uniref:LIAT1-like 4 n=1 Tax=Homarus americanus TaxID=6706 RepID=A0A8J5N0B6_HOMAM|nr:LIAT1-like 4 [Homarus americanus]